MASGGQVGQRGLAVKPTATALGIKQPVIPDGAGHVGIEYAFAPNWTGKVEGQYLGLNDFTVGPGVLGDSLRVRSASVNTLTFGINYLFNWGAGYPAPPVVGRY